MTKAQFRAVLERAVKTFFQALLAFILASGVSSFTEVPWAEAANVAAFALALSLVTSIASWNFGSGDGPSLTTETVDDELKAA
jgi:hypothetical protein